MKRLIGIVSALFVLAAFSFGCSGLGYVSKDTNVKCPNCGQVFTIDKGMKSQPSQEEPRQVP